MWIIYIIGLRPMTGSLLFTHQLSLLIILLNPLVTDYVVSFLITSMKRSYSKLYSSFFLYLNLPSIPRDF